ncbi:hypothetical protein ACFP3Q_12510 [Nocardioides sp. GCM10027113]|uniref:hypothetical protein n=1 Tax=unclassified Nocardioides TaxID=2615069 RepID=UPI0036180720
MAGLAWSGALRGWMGLLVGPESRLTWRTPVLVLLPGAVVGGLLGWASALTAAGRHPPPALVLAPCGFAVALLDPKTARSLVTDGQGGGALVVVATALSGGHALAHRGWTRPRIATATLATLGVATLTAMGSMAGPLTSRRGLGTALLGGSLMTALCVAASLPYERQGRHSGGRVSRSGRSR